MSTTTAAGASLLVWRLRQVMATHGMFRTTDLVPLLEQRGVHLSRSQVHRVVTCQPARLSLPLLAALCDILDCTASDLLTTLEDEAGRSGR